MGNWTSRSEHQTQNEEQVNGEGGAHEQDVVVGKEHERVQEQDQGESPEQLTECIDEFTSFIKREATDLEYLIKTKFGLLDALVSNCRNARRPVCDQEDV